MTFFLSKDVSIYSFSNENVDYRKNYTSYYIFKTALIESCGFIKDS